MGHKQLNIPEWFLNGFHPVYYSKALFLMIVKKMRSLLNGRFFFLGGGEI